MKSFNESIKQEEKETPTNAGFYECDICASQGRRAFFGSKADLELHKRSVHKAFEQKPEHEWEGFHAVGSMATPERNYRKTISALREYAHTEKTSIISDVVLAELLNYYWSRESHGHVKQKLVDDGYLRPLDSRRLQIAEKGAEEAKNGKMEQCEEV